MVHPLFVYSIMPIALNPIRKLDSASHYYKLKKKLPLNMQIMDEPFILRFIHDFVAYSKISRPLGRDILLYTTKS